jgi:hypothetical protein
LGVTTTVPTPFRESRGKSDLEKQREIERFLQSRFDKDARPRTSGDSRAAPRGVRSALDQLILSDEERAKLPETKDKFLVRENPHLIQWEREVRKFLRKLNPNHGHRVSAAMVYEWATGINIAELYKAGGTAGAHLRSINRILVYYFGKPYMTYILGRKVPKAYRVPPGWYVTRHRPMTLTLFHEWSSKTLQA